MNLTQFYPEQSVIDKWENIVPKGIVVHHTASSVTMKKEDLRDWFIIGRKSEGYSWIGYTALIYQDGTIIQTRPFDKKAGHAPGYNGTHIGISFVGDFTKEKPTREAWSAFVELCTYLMDTYKFEQSEIIPHVTAKKLAKLGSTACPGNHILELLKTPFIVEKTKNEPDLSAFSTKELAIELVNRL